MEKITPKPIPLAVQKPESLAKPTPAIKQKAKAVEAAEKFETMMAQQMVKSMQTSLEGGNLLGTGAAADIYSGLGEWELAKLLSRNGHLGLKEQILRQLPKEEGQGQ
jgi:Rod binding domain-containing protein